MTEARGRGRQWRALAAGLSLVGLIVASAGAGNALGAAATKPVPPKPVPPSPVPVPRPAPAKPPVVAAAVGAVTRPTAKATPPMATRAPTSSRAVPVDARFFFGVVEATRGAGANEVGAATGTGFTGVLGTGSVAQVGGGVEPGWVR